MVKDGKLFCDRCKKGIIEDTAYVIVSGNVVMFDPNIKKPMVFTCIEQMYNFAQKFILHPQCWINTLADHGIALYDMQEVAKGYKKVRRREGRKSFKSLWNWWEKSFFGKVKIKDRGKEYKDKPKN